MSYEMEDRPDLDAAAMDTRTHFGGVPMTFYDDYSNDDLGLKVHVRSKK